MLGLGCVSGLGLFKTKPPRSGRIANSACLRLVSTLRDRTSDKKNLADELLKRAMLISSLALFVVEDSTLGRGIFIISSKKPIVNSVLHLDRVGGKQSIVLSGCCH